MDDISYEQKQIYKKNRFIVKVFGSGPERKIQVTAMKAVRTSDYMDVAFEASDKCTVNEQKLICNIVRARSRIFELAYCNEWDHFFTGTVNPKLYSRSDLPKFHSAFTNFIRDYNRHNSCGVNFLVVPELHSDGKSWHLHGFLSGIPETLLHRFVIGDSMSASIAYRVKCGSPVYDWPAYHKKFGFCDLEPIRNKEAVCKYITKYISKELGRSVSGLGEHMFYHSRGLKGAMQICSGKSDKLDLPFDYTGDYCSVAWLDYSDDLLLSLARVSDD